MTTTCNLTLALSLAYLGKPVAYDPGAAGWKKKEDGSLEVDDQGNPIYTDSSGRELALGVDTVSRLNREAQSQRERAEAAEAAAKKFEGIDPEKARKDADMLSKIDQKKLIDAGEVDKVREEVRQTLTGQIEEQKKERDEMEQRVINMTRQSAFNQSKFIDDKIAVPVDMIQSTFGSNFKYENGQLVPYGQDGNKIYSKKRAGETATFDEALEQMVENYPYRDQILKGGNHSGTGNGGAGGSNGGGRIVRRADFEAMSPAQQAQTAQQAGKGELTIRD